MRLLFTTSNDHVPWGGSEELWLSCLIKALCEGFEVGIFVQWNPLPIKLTELRYNSNIKWFQKKVIYQSFFLKQIDKLILSKFKIGKRERFKKSIVEWKPDLIIISQGNNADGLALMEFCITNNLNYCTISQAVYEGIWPNSAKSALMRKCYSDAIANYFVSKANLTTTILQTGENVKNATIVRNPFNVPYNNNLTFPDTNVYKVACVARYEFYAKGQDVLLEVMSLEKWRNRNIEVTFYGSGPNEDNIHRLINHFDLKNVFVGGQRQTIEIWKENHALIMPSRFEGLPLALVEAMLSGRFGIVTDVSGNNEAFVDQESGFLAEAPKAKYLDKAMEQAWERRHEWETIGQKAMQYIKTLVSIDPGQTLLDTIITDYLKG